MSKGVTTIWERWNGYTHLHGVIKRQGSLNHYAYGAIGEWMYQRIAGICPLEAGYRKIRIAPVVGGSLTFAHGEYESPYGRIESRWKITEDTFQLFVTIPPNTIAEVLLPAAYNQDVRIDDNPSHQNICSGFHLAAGSYNITARQAQ